MKSDRPTITTLRKEFQTPDDCDADPDPAEVTVRGDEPPQRLADAVHAALDRTILHLLDGRDVVWKQDGDRWILTLPSGFPEYPTATPNGTMGFAPPYRTREQFEGADASGDGLLDNLPGDWTFDPKNRTSYVFYQDPYTA